MFHRARGGKGGLPRDLARLQALLTRGLELTATLWPDIRRAYGWVHQAAHLLANADGHDVWTVRRAYRHLLAELIPFRDAPDFLGVAARHFLRVTRSYWPGLFCCYQVPDLPRTNNDLEHWFGAARYHERRASGRKLAAPGTVVRGAVRLVAAAATRQQTISVADLPVRDRPRWRQLRQELEQRHDARRAQRRFRQDPDAYLTRLEEQLLKVSLPA